MAALPEDPPTFRSPSPADRPWWWRLEDASGAVVESAALEEHAQQRFPNQADAESWIGETYAELSDAGVARVTLFENDREVYGPMSLSA